MFIYKGYSHEKTLGMALVAVVASGCQAVPRGGEYARPNYGASYNYAAAQQDNTAVAHAAVGGQAVAIPVAAPQMAAPVQDMNAGYGGSTGSYNASSAQVEAAVLNLKERLERVEKAMLRLDRRMQLVEKNELSRMSGQGAAAEPARDLSGTEEQVALRALNLGPASYTPDQGLASTVEGFQAVSSRANTPITSALQAAPRVGSFGAAEPLAAPRRVAGLPSLADPTEAENSGNGKMGPAAQVAIWTVKYGVEGTWPDREQLVGSRDVVETLRQTGGLTLYARGKNANGVQFRERVKALSRYLAKVSSLDSVPIVAMAAPHLDDQTIEILATH